jgi:hypothetical protein
VALKPYETRRRGKVKADLVEELAPVSIHRARNLLQLHQPIIDNAFRSRHRPPGDLAVIITGRT